MHIQKSFMSSVDNESAILYLVGTPIGNLEDMSSRAIRILREADWVAAEDTRQTRKLMAHFEISTRLISYHEHNKQTSGRELLRKLKSGESVALVSDAGLPAISDPGAQLVELAIAEHIRVVPIPGANAALSALIVSGLSTEAFIFIGFLPRDKKRSAALLEQLRRLEVTLLLYESPHRLSKTLQLLLDNLGDRTIALVRELTKKHEEIARGKLSECLMLLKEQPPRGEYCIVIEGNKLAKQEEANSLWWSLLTVTEHVEHYIEKGMDRMAAIKKVASERQVTKRDIYNKLI